MIQKLIRIVSILRGLCLISLLCLLSVWLWQSLVNHDPVHRWSDSSSRMTLDDCVDTQQATNASFRCVKTKLLLKKYQTSVCVHEVENDRDVSRSLISSGIWEERLVEKFLRILSMFPRYAFFDIGANLGIYTMYAASMGCANVISIECFQPNLERIRRAIQLEHVQSRVVLVPRALYTKSNVFLSLRANIANNIGSHRVTSEVSPKEANDSMVVRTMRFDDLLDIVDERKITEAIVKIDIETSEDVLCETGGRMFDRVNIPLIMMEWANIKTIRTKAELIRSFFLDRHYNAFDPETCRQQNATNDQHWQSQDILWIKRNYEYLC